MLKLFCLLATLLILNLGLRTSLAKLDVNQAVIKATVLTAISRATSHRLGNQQDDANSTEFRDFAMSDSSNDNIGRNTTQQIILRSGFSYENHYVVANDGYITQLIRLVNRKATKLKGPPVMLMHGGLIDPTVYVWASAIQHHPEKFPRRLQDGPITSWNRSLAFVLSNAGYDVWLIGTRGCNEQNQGHISQVSVPGEGRSHQNRFQAEHHAGKNEMLKSLSYWNYTMDDIVEYELPRQIDHVLETTGFRKVSLLGYSISSQITLALLSSSPTYAHKVHNYICMAPCITISSESNELVQLASKLVENTKDELGTIVFTNLLLSSFIRELFIELTKSKQIRYSVYLEIVSQVVGFSETYLTLLEPAVVGHIMMPLGFKHSKHFAQQVLRGQLQKFDFGPLKNQLLYGSSTPPAYNISNIHVQNWMLVWAGKDNLGVPASAKIILDTVRPRPTRRVFLPGYNHIDLFAAQNNDVQVNQHILNFLDNSHLSPQPRRLIAKNMTSSRIPRLMKKSLPVGPLLSEGITPVHENTS